MAAPVIPLRPVDFEINMSGVVDEVSRAAMAPVFALAERMRVEFERDGILKASAISVEVRISEQFRAALLSDGAFEVVVELGKGGG